MGAPTGMDGPCVLMRELWNLCGEAVEAAQSVVNVDEVAAIPDALDGRRISVEFRPDGSVVAIRPGLGIIYDLETFLGLFGDRDAFRRHLLGGAALGFIGAAGFPAAADGGVWAKAAGTKAARAKAATNDSAVISSLILMSVSFRLSTQLTGRRKI